MKLRHALPFGLLLAWQVAPQRPDSTPSRTRVSLSLGYALASLEDYTPAQFDCNGNQVSNEQSQAVDVQSRGARLDVVRDRLRVTGFAGRATSRLFDVAGSFSGFQLAWEGQREGLGAGLTFGVPYAISSTSPEPNVYVRIGAAQRLHLRSDFMAPSETFGAVNYWRVGVACDASQSRGISVFAGTGQMAFGSLVGVLDLAVPMPGGLDLLLHGLVGPGHQNPPWGLGLGARFTFPR